MLLLFAKLLDSLQSCQKWRHVACHRIFELLDFRSKFSVDAAELSDFLPLNWVVLKDLIGAALWSGLLHYGTSNCCWVGCRAINCSFFSTVNRSSKAREARTRARRDLHRIYVELGYSLRRTHLHPRWTLCFCSRGTFITTAFRLCL